VRRSALRPFFSAAVEADLHRSELCAAIDSRARWSSHDRAMLAEILTDANGAGALRLAPQRGEKKSGRWSIRVPERDEAIL